jgi:hypothetical protein
VQKELEDPLSTLLLAGGYPEGTVFSAESRNGNIFIHAKVPAKTENPLYPVSMR